MDGHCVTFRSTYTARSCIGCLSVKWLSSIRVRIKKWPCQSYPYPIHACVVWGWNGLQRGTLLETSLCRVLEGFVECQMSGTRQNFSLSSAKTAIDDSGHSPSVFAECPPLDTRQIFFIFLIYFFYWVPSFWHSAKFFLYFFKNNFLIFFQVASS